MQSMSCEGANCWCRQQRPNLLAAASQPQMPRVGFGYEFSWSREPGGRSTVSSSGYGTAAEADGAFRRSLVEMGYTKPKLWQWWRWSEARPHVL